jgi:hypothetical protein
MLKYRVKAPHETWSVLEEEIKDLAGLNAGRELRRKSRVR